MGREVRRGIGCKEGERVKGNRKYRKGRDESFTYILHRRSNCINNDTLSIFVCAKLTS